MREMGITEGLRTVNSQIESGHSEEHITINEERSGAILLRINAYWGAITITNTLEFINNAKSRTMGARFVLEGGRVAYEMRGERKERRFK